LRILPLEEDTVKEYIASLNNPVLMNLLSDPNMLMMLRNPMLLTMFCNSFDAEGYDLDLNGETLTLTPGELIEHCVVAQLRKSGSRNLRTFFDILCLFPMVIADMYYKGTLRNMSVSRIELSKALTSLLQNLDTDTLEAFYLPEYADKWQLDDTSNEEFDSLMTFLREHKPLEIRNEFGIFERVMSKVLQFFTMDDERSRIGGNSYRFDHQTSFNWYISYGIYIMAELMPQRFNEIIRDLTDGVDLSMEKTDDFEEQSEFIFDLIRDYAEDEDYRHFAAKLHNVHFKRRTSRIYHIAVNCISLFDKADVSDEEYANEVASFCFSLFGLGKRNTPPGMNEEDIVRKYGEKLETVKKKAARIKNEEDRNVCLAKIYTIEGAYNLALFRLYKASHKDSEETWEVLKNYALQAGEFQKKALKIREDVIANGSGKYTDEMKNRIAYSYTSLGTVAYNLKEFEKSVEYHKKALALREEIAGDPGIAEWIRKDAKLSESVNLSRINGSTMARGNLTKEELLEIFKREDLLSETRIETEMIDRVKTFAKEITFIQDEEVLDKAYATYELLFDAYAKMFGFQSPELIKAGNSLDALRYEFNPVLSANEKIDRFIKSDAFQTVVKIFNDGNEMTDLEKLNEFADHWDYRRKMASGGERQAIQTEDPFVAEHREEIIRSFRKLGMLDEKKEDFPVPDYILPLGGFGASNLKRLELAKKIHDMYPDQNVRVVALSSQRPLTDPNEFDAIKDFAPDAKTEFEEVDEAMKCAFRLTNPPVLETHNEPGTREYWTLSRYQSENPAQIFDNLSAPCTDPNRQRANTADTFRHFLKCFDVKKGSIIFLVSTSLYEPYQTFTILPDAIEAGVKLTFIGGAYKEHDEEIIATLCLCDLKSAVNAMASFRRRFPK
ncbi:MAG: tetratricopeptide repeat protein, partial [Erysipelotrichales bacterium]|nr:tetratricopeptide repeat protein [Erysipelotrichales bacterium]